MKSAMKRAAGGVALTMVLIRGFCGGGVFLGYLGIEIEGLLIANNRVDARKNRLLQFHEFSYNISHVG